MEFLKNNPKWIRQPKQVQISEDKVIILTERGTDLWARTCLLYTSPSPRDGLLSRMTS